MNVNDSPIPSESNPGWQQLGKLDLQAGTETDNILQSKLLKILAPLDLPVHFLNRILRSIQDSAARALESDAVMKTGHVHIVIFAQQDHNSAGKTWGYFHTAKMSSREDDAAMLDHQMDLYLYLDGES